MTYPYAFVFAICAVLTLFITVVLKDYFQRKELSRWTEKVLNLDRLRLETLQDKVGTMWGISSYTVTESLRQVAAKISENEQDNEQNAHKKIEILHLVKNEYDREQKSYYLPRTLKDKVDRLRNKEPLSEKEIDSFIEELKTVFTTEKEKNEKAWCLTKWSFVIGFLGFIVGSVGLWLSLYPNLSESLK